MLRKATREQVAPAGIQQQILQKKRKKLRNIQKKTRLWVRTMFSQLIGISHKQAQACFFLFFAFFFFLFFFMQRTYMPYSHYITVFLQLLQQSFIAVWMLNCRNKHLFAHSIGERVAKGSLLAHCVYNSDSNILPFLSLGRGGRSGIQAL